MTSRALRYFLCLSMCLLAARVVRAQPFDMEPSILLDEVRWQHLAGWALLRIHVRLGRSSRNFLGRVSPDGRLDRAVGRERGCQPLRGATENSGRPAPGEVFGCGLLRARARASV